jgi:hypothetical protein
MHDCLAGENGEEYYEENEEGAENFVIELLETEEEEQGESDEDMDVE